MDNMSQKRSVKTTGFNLALLTRNSFFAALSRLIEICGGALFFIILSRYLGVSDFGIYITLSSLALILVSILDFGQDHILVREYPIVSEKSRALLSALLIRLSGGIILFPVIFAIAFFSGFSPLEIFGLSLLCLGQYVRSAITQIMRTVFVAAERVEYDVIVSFFFNALRLLLLVMIIRSNGSLQRIFMIILGTELATALIACLLVRGKILPFGKKFSSDSIRSFLIAGFPIGCIVFLNSFFSNSDIVFVKNFLNAAEAGIYGAAHKIIMYVNIIFISMIWILTPTLSRFRKEENEGFKKAISRTMHYTLLLLALPVLILMFSGSEILGIFGEGFERGGSLLAFFALLLIPMSLQYILSLVLLVRNRQWEMSLILGISLFISLGLIIFLIPHFGSSGAIAAKGIGLLISVGIIIFRLREDFDRVFFIQDFLRIVLVGLLTLFLSSLVKISLGFYSILSIPFIFIVLAHYFGVFLPDDRQLLKKLLNRWS